jgi:16S rRNA (adenine1518-N6/adenine1519-N6)-dimethyltransferase
LEQGPKPNLIILTIQKEVAQRIVAQPPRMNLLALSVQAFGQPKIIKTVPASCFWPKPKVDSAIIKITDISDNFFKKNGLKVEEFFRIARIAFGQKRKLLTNTLTKIAPKKDIEAILKEAGINPKARPEELSLEQWTKIILGINKNRR